MKNSKNELPIVRIKNAWLLRENASVLINELKGDGQPLRSDEYYSKITKKYAKAWAPYEYKIMNGITNILGLDFRQNIIDVHIAPWFMAFSEPMVVGVIFEPDDFIDVLTHEMLHRLLTDNTLIPHETKLKPEWQKLFGKNHTFNALVHIPVHAVHKAIFFDVLKEPARYDREISMLKKSNSVDYLAAWDYVEEQGYKQIIDQLKKSYKELAKNS